MMWEMQKETRDGLKEHCRIHKIDIDKIHEDNADIKQSISDLTKAVALLTQKVECAPLEASKPPRNYLTSWKIAAAGAVALIAGIIEGLQYVKKI
jgi:hypothetical protein